MEKKHYLLIFSKIARTAWNPSANKTPTTSNTNPTVQNTSTVPSQSTQNVEISNTQRKNQQSNNVSSSSPSSTQNVQSVSGVPPNSSTSNVSSSQNSMLEHDVPQQIPPQQPPQLSAPVQENTILPPMKQVEKPRVGVLLPGDFTSDDSMSFQFGNLGLLEDDLVARNQATSVTESEISKTSQNPPVNVQSTKSQEVQNNNNLSKQNEQEQESMGPSPSPMNMPYGSPQFPIFPGMETGDHLRGPPMVVIIFFIHYFFFLTFTDFFI